VQTLPRARSPLARAAGALDLVIIREQTEGCSLAKTPASCCTTQLCDRYVGDDPLGRSSGVCEFAFQLAAQRKHASPTAARARSPAWTRRTSQELCLLPSKCFDNGGRSSHHRHRPPEHTYIDAQALYLVQRPGRFDVLVTENMFGDILSDLAAGLIGGMGMAPSADIGDRHAVLPARHGTAQTSRAGASQPRRGDPVAGMMLRLVGRRHGPHWPLTASCGA